MVKGYNQIISLGFCVTTVAMSATFKRQKKE
jgi:hypothetical protein